MFSTKNRLSMITVHLRLLIIYILLGKYFVSFISIFWVTYILPITVWHVFVLNLENSSLVVSSHIICAFLGFSILTELSIYMDLN